ncbi:enoyl-CoA hydratase/isomerase family protein [Mariniblastus fucicola]|uniref:Carnitinyl-CoA dehydratase n=1 Tax=Mariniblastus fucicola TaxID=980251 RepID=A0A5B9PIV9_9BACT|nr:enoyl-CoA hydratase/isomerase family protein [Mariniblastus fucicola]QEG24626.1 Carnitinyl-CoA dehydratase [Mariniblastus fucicola]
MIAISDNVQIRKDPPSGTILINRPDKHNALSREIVSMIDQAFQDFHQERNVRGVILTGAGDTFCSGTDLVQLQETAEAKDAMQQWHQDANEFRGLIELMLRYPKPIVCAANGPVVGSGVALMLASDLVVASDKATISIPESLRGLSPGLTMPLLSYRLGTGLAARLLFSGQTIDAATARELGLFHEIVSEDFVWAKSQEVVSRTALTARESHQMTKQFLTETVGEQLLMQLSIAAANMAAARTTLAAKEGIAAFLEKRDPDWDKPTEF